MDFIIFMKTILTCIAEITHDECKQLVLHKYYDIWCPNSLGGMCASASLILKYVLKQYGFKSKIIEYYNCGSHCWVICGEWHIDITTKQFDGPPVYVETKPYLDLNSLVGSHSIPSNMGKVYYYLDTLERDRQLFLNRGWFIDDILETSEIAKIGNEIIRKINLTHSNFLYGLMVS